MIAAVSRYTAPSGICRYADTLAACLGNIEGAETALAIAPWQEAYFRSLFNAEKHSSLHVVDVKAGAVSRNLWPFLGLPGLARRLKTDLIHLSYPLPFLRRWLPCPVVVTVHDLYAFDLAENFRFASANRQFFRLCLSQADGIVCISKATQQRLEQIFPALSNSPRVTQIYNAIPEPSIAPDQGPVAELRPKQFVLSVGQHRKNKNLDILQRSFAQLLLSGSLSEDTKLVVVGSEEHETAHLHALTAELDLTGKVVYLSGINGSELAWLYKHCGILVAPSSNEGLCMPVIEGLLSGAKVVCSDIPVLREIGGDACTYFSLEGDPVTGLAAAIKHSIEAPAKSTGLMQRFAPDFAAEQLRRFYDTLLFSIRHSTEVEVTKLTEATRR